MMFEVKYLCMDAGEMASFAQGTTAKEAAQNSWLAGYRDGDVVYILEVVRKGTVTYNPCLDKKIIVLDSQ